MNVRINEEVKFTYPVLAHFATLLVCNGKSIHTEVAGKTVWENSLKSLPDSLFKVHYDTT